MIACLHIYLCWYVVYFCLLHGSLLFTSIMMTSSIINMLRYWPFVGGNSSVTGGFPSRRQVTRNFDVSFDLRLNKRLSKQLRRRWFGTPARSLWRHCNDDIDIHILRVGLCKGIWCSCSHQCTYLREHYSDVMMSAMVSQTTSLTIVYLTVYSGANHKLCVTGLCAGNSPVIGNAEGQ